MFALDQSWLTLCEKGLLMSCVVKHRELRLLCIRYIGSVEAMYTVNTAVIGVCVYTIFIYLLGKLLVFSLFQCVVHHDFQDC